MVVSGQVLARYFRGIIKSTKASLEISGEIGLGRRVKVSEEVRNIGY